MTHETLEIRTQDGVMDVHLHGAAGQAVIMYPDAGGVRPAAHEMAERLAKAGYLVALPNFFYRSGPFAPFNMKTVFGDAAERERIMGMIKSADAPTTIRDASTLIDELRKRPGVRAEKVGFVGYCMGGRLAFIAAGAMPDRVAAAAAFHPGGIATEQPESPHLAASKISAALYFGIAHKDASCDDAAQARLKVSLDAAKVRYSLEVYEAMHGYAVPDTAAFDTTAAERHWTALLAHFGAHLPKLS